MKSRFTALLLILTSSFIFNILVQAQVNFPMGSQYRYLKGINASTLASNWMTNGFDDFGWTVGNTPFRYADGTGGTDLTDMQNNYSTLYLRSKFTASNIDLIKNLIFTINYDDGFIIWINGSEVIRHSAPTTPSYNAFASENHESGTNELFVIDSDMVNLVDGENTIAIQGFNVSLESSDFYFDIQIGANMAIPEVPDSIKVNFSKNAGFCNSPFNLTLTSPDNTLNIVYTIDGSNPQTSSTAFTAGTSTQININPSSSDGRPVTPAYIVRASLVKPGLAPSKPVTQTYIFIESVKTQAYPGGGWPNYNVNDQVMNYPMAQEIVQSSAYSGLIDDALLQIPSISLVTDLPNLFDPSTGIYVNAFGRGVEWEKFTSVELINPDGSEGFQINGGLRIRGGYSRNNWFPKHGFRLFFRKEYGVGKLNYPLFENEGVDHFDKIDLRCEQNYSWANGSWQNTLVRDVFSRDSQRDMGQPYARSRYYHLYLNGMYWGIFQTEERPEASYSEDYFGGKQEDYDVIKVNGANGNQVEAADGTINSWQQLYTMCNTGFASNTNYFKLEGKDENGKNIPGQKVLVDIDNLIDYMLVIFYTGNFDAPVSAFGGNSMANNFYANYNRNELSQGNKFICHDSEHSLMAVAYSPGIGINENRVTIPSMNITSLGTFNPQWLHHKLTVNAEYRQRFADRAALALTNNGVFTKDKCLARFNARVSQINMAVIAESARWGGGSITKDNAWIPELNVVRNQFFPYRTSIVLDQLNDADLYSSVNPPVIKNQSTELKDNIYTITGSYSVTVKNPNSSGKIYLTLNGTDPRKLGGAISSEAIAASADTTFSISTSAVILARIYSNNTWSPLRKIEFFGTQDNLANLKVTELHYHPADVINGNDTTNGKAYEFIEFKNVGSTSLNLSGLVLDSAVFYQFPANSILAPGKFYVIAAKPSYFFERYAMLPSGNSEGFFDNSGELVLLNDSQGNKLLSFRYSDGSPWPTSADGDGYTLTSLERNPTSNPADEIYWKASSTINGSPFSDDYQYSFVEPVIVTSIGNYQLYPNPVADNLFVRLNSDETDYSIENYLTIYSLNGSKVFETTFTNETVVDMSGLNISAGMYLVRINNDTSTQTEKIIYRP